MFTEKGMTGGISYIAKTHNKAINKYMQSYDVNEPSKFTTYLDGKNLHGWAMIQYLPCSRFKWFSWWEFDNFDVNTICENSSDRYVLGVDLEYSDKLHKLHDDYPLAPEKLEISHTMLSNYCSSIANKSYIKIGGVNNLVPN